MKNPRKLKKNAMVGVNKPFDKELFLDSDPHCREKIKEFFSQFDIELQDNPLMYAEDLITENYEIRIETERRIIWTGDNFPYKTVHILERKKKYFQDGKVHYCVVSKNFDRMAFISAEKIKKYITPKNLRHNPNRFAKKEYQYPVPISDFEIYPL